jgi:hypothetical protein
MSSTAGLARPAPDTQYATDGSGPLLQRDYWAVLDGSRCDPADVAAKLRASFERYAPPETASFRRADDPDGRLGVGDEMAIRIALRGACRVRVVHHNHRSLTLRTLKGHPEAGRITFGAYRDRGGRLAFRIRSRTRAAGPLHYLGYWLMGKQLQSRCWIKFVEGVARDCGGQIVDCIHVRTSRVEEEPGDGPGEDSPTFACCDGAD